LAEAAKLGLDLSALSAEARFSAEDLERAIAQLARSSPATVDHMTRLLAVASQHKFTRF